MRATLIAALGASAFVLLGACQTTPDADKPAPGAAVEDRTKPGAKPGTQAQRVERPQIAAVDVSGAARGAAALKDPASILSRRQIYFDYDRFDIKEEFRPLIEAHAKYLRENPSAKMLVQGNADERGSREYNVALGQKRADSVKRMLVLLGARDGQLEAVSLGEEKPACTEHNEQCWSKNRRGDMLYGGEY
jgi:peptidoglycan-associated lipoprotein